MRILSINRLRAALRIVTRRYEFGWWLWGIYGVVIVLSTVNEAPSVGGVCSIYFRSGAEFLAGRPLYADPQFLYLPTAVFFFAPFSLAPFPLMTSLWRLMNLAVYSAGIYSLTNAKRTNGQSIPFAWVSAIACLLSIGGSKNGQMTLTVAGLLMLAAVNLERSRVWSASFLMALSLALKPITLPFLLLAAVVTRATIWRTILVALILALLPFLIQSFSYVLDQYTDAPRMLFDTVQRKDTTLVPSLIGIMEVVGVSLGSNGKLVARTLFAAGALLVFVVGRSRTQEAADRSLLLYGIAVGYILLLSPATERNTYLLLAPVVGVLWCLARAKKQRGDQVALAFVTLSSILSHTLMKMLPGVLLIQIIKPIGAIVVMVILCIHFQWPWNHPLAQPYRWTPRLLRK